MSSERDDTEGALANDEYGPGDGLVEGVAGDYPDGLPLDDPEAEYRDADDDTATRYYAYTQGVYGDGAEEDEEFAEEAGEADYYPQYHQEEEEDAVDGDYGDARASPSDRSQPRGSFTQAELEAAQNDRRRSGIQKGIELARQHSQSAFRDEAGESDDADASARQRLEEELDGLRNLDADEDEFGEDELANLDKIEGRTNMASDEGELEGGYSNPYLRSQNEVPESDCHNNSHLDFDALNDTVRTAEQDLQDALAERQALRKIHARRQRKILQLWARDPNLQRSLQSLADGRDGLLLPGYDDIEGGNSSLVDGPSLGGLGNTEPLQKLYYEKLDRLSRAWDQLDQRREEADAKIDRLTSILDRHDERLVKLTDTFRMFKRATALEATHSATRRKIDKQVLLSLEEREQKVDRDLAEARLRYINVTNYLAKLEKSIKQKEELAGGLHAIDFEQLRVENATLHDQIEERSDHLHKLRKKTVATVQILTHVREKLHFVRQKNKELASKLDDGNSEVGALRDRVGKAKQLRDQLRADNAVLKQKQGFIGSDRLVHDFESRKADLVVLKSKVENLKARYRELHEIVLRANAEIARANGSHAAAASATTTIRSGSAGSGSKGSGVRGLSSNSIHLPNVRRNDSTH